ncbi:MAG: hypothetical protein V7K14_20880 [Nostoc sp.]
MPTASRSRKAKIKSTNFNQMVRQYLDRHFLIKGDRNLYTKVRSPLS